MIWMAIDYNEERLEPKAAPPKGRRWTLMEDQNRTRLVGTTDGASVAKDDITTTV